MGAEEDTPFRTTKEAVDPLSSAGTCALICRGETKNNGAAMPPISTVVFASRVGRGKEEAAAVVADKFVPKMERIEPGDREPGPGAKLAPLTMAAGGTCT